MHLPEEASTVAAEQQAICVLLAEAMLLPEAVEEALPPGGAVELFWRLLQPLLHQLGPKVEEAQPPPHVLLLQQRRQHWVRLSAAGQVPTMTRTTKLLPHSSQFYIAILRTLHPYTCSLGVMSRISNYDQIRSSAHQQLRKHCSHRWFVHFGGHN